MKTLISATALGLMIATSATASSITFSLPNLQFPPKTPDIVTQDCPSFDAAADTCETQE